LVELGVGVAADAGQQRLFVPFRLTSATICWASTSSGARGMCRASSSPGARSRAGDAFDQVVAGGGEQAPLGVPPTWCPERPTVAGSRRSNRRGDLADQVDIADIDAQLQRRGGDQHLQLAALEPLFGIQAAPWPGCRGARPRRLAQALAEVPGSVRPGAGC
jgi:hypothetical protein